MVHEINLMDQYNHRSSVPFVMVSSWVTDPTYIFVSWSGRIVDPATLLAMGSSGVLESIWGFAMGSRHNQGCGVDGTLVTPTLTPAWEYRLWLRLHIDSGLEKGIPSQSRNIRPPISSLFFSIVPRWGQQRTRVHQPHPLGDVPSAFLADLVLIKTSRV